VACTRLQRDELEAEFAATGRTIEHYARRAEIIGLAVPDLREHRNAFSHYFRRAVPTLEAYESIRRTIVSSR